MGYVDLSLARLEENLALDEALLLAAEEDGAGSVLRLWEWPNLAVILGASGRLRDEVKVAACERDGVAIGRRASGGGTVVIGRGALNFAVVLPIASAPELTAVATAQRYVLGRVADALNRGDVCVAVQGSGDLTVCDRKVCGSAQRRLRKHVLIHATILYQFPLDAIARYLRIPDRQPAYRRGRSHDEFVANIAVDRPALARAISSAFLDSAPAINVGSLPLERTQRLAYEKYGDRAWVARF
jgi:lipoate-protein ligase A